MRYAVEEIRYLSTDGEHKIYAKIFSPEKDSKGIVQICHGMNGYIGKYDELAIALVKQGYVVCGNTHLGHKESMNNETEFGFFGEFNGAKYLVNDVEKLTKIVKAKYPHLNLFLMGHSMGSFIARAYLLEHSDELKGAIFSATAGPQFLDDSAIAFLNAIIAKHGYHFRSEKIYHILFKTANRHIKDAKNDYAWISQRAEEFVSALMKKLFTVTGLRDIAILIKRCNAQSDIDKLPKDLPLYFFSGTEDPLGEYGEGVKRAVKLYEKAGMRDVTLRLYEGDRHECLSENNKEQVMQDMIDWIEKRNQEEKEKCGLD